MNTFTHKPVRIVSIVLLFLIGINAIAAGCAFVIDPSGRALGITTELLKHSPFTNFLIPGILLFGAIGLLSISIAVLTIRNVKTYPYLILLQGCIITGWIVIQIIFLQIFHPLHLIIGVSGIFLVINGVILRGK